MSLRFLDSNVVIYSVSRTPGKARKRDAAADILLRKDNALSVQVLQEFYTHAVRPTGSIRATHEDARAIAAGLRRFPVQPMTLAVFDAALAIRAARGFSYWDCAILAAAQALGCAEVLTEDMQHGQVVDGLRIVDPFR